LNYNHDEKLKQLIAIDYYLAHKVKPQLLFLKEISNENKQELIQQHQLNLHKFRYLFFEIDFNYNLFKEQQILIEGKNNIILKYTGTDHAQVLV
jgi:hypothetical protein